VLNGRSFSDVGPYERIAGRVYFSVASSNPHNRRIVDLDNAVNLKNGEVEFSSDFVALCPKNARKGNGSMILEILIEGSGGWQVSSTAVTGTPLQTQETPGYYVMVSPL
jgi:hypothetical protein